MQPRRGRRRSASRSWSPTSCGARPWRGRDGKERCGNGKARGGGGRWKRLLVCLFKFFSKSKRGEKKQRRGLAPLHTCFVADHLRKQLLFFLFYLSSPASCLFSSLQGVQSARSRSTRLAERKRKRKRKRIWHTSSARRRGRADETCQLSRRAIVSIRKNPAPLWRFFFSPLSLFSFSSLNLSRNLLLSFPELPKQRQPTQPPTNQLQ